MMKHPTLCSQCSRLEPALDMSGISVRLETGMNPGSLPETICVQWVLLGSVKEEETSGPRIQCWDTVLGRRIEEVEEEISITLLLSPLKLV